MTGRTDRADGTALFGCAAVCLAAAACSSGAGDWPVYGGDAGAMKYSPLTSITRENVRDLALAWEWSVGEERIPETDSTRAARPGNFQATPLMVNDTLFLSTPYNRVVALNAETGEEYWSYDPGAYRWGQPSNGTGFVHRGVATWTGGGPRRIFLNSRWRLIALDAATGQPIGSFGDGGEVDLTAGLIWDVTKIHYTNTSPPVIYDNLVIVGNGVGDRLTYENDPPGDVQAFDVRSGERVWSFHTIPQEGEFGNETWENESWRRVGHTNVWAPMSLDVERGLLYLPVSTPSNDFYGGARLGDNLFAESIVALSARTGERVWHFQTIRHGLWDYDIPAPPILGTIHVDGRTIDAVIVLGKTGFAYVFDRVSGEPVWPIEDRLVPASDMPGERAAPRQPFPTRPAPFARQGFSEDDVIDFTPELESLARETLSRFRIGDLFTPPSRQGTVLSPGLIGGAGWGGGAFDPETGILYVKANESPSVIRLWRPPASDTIQAAWSYRRGVSFSVEIPPEMIGAPPGTDVPSLPLGEPPYGTMTAIDMNTGEHLWQVPVGDTPRVRNHPLLRDMDLPPLGVTGSPGPMVTRGGLIFVTGGGETLYALDVDDGGVLWEYDLGARGYANPMTYRTSNRRQFVVIATGRGDGKLMAFALGI